jgi:hypothetical protein
MGIEIFILSDYFNKSAYYIAACDGDSFTLVQTGSGVLPASYPRSNRAYFVRGQEVGA